MQLRDDSRQLLDLTASANISSLGPGVWQCKACLYVCGQAHMASHECPEKTPDIVSDFKNDVCTFLPAPVKKKAKRVNVAKHKKMCFKPMTFTEQRPCCKRGGCWQYFDNRVVIIFVRFFSDLSGGLSEVMMNTGHIDIQSINSYTARRCNLGETWLTTLTSPDRSRRLRQWSYVKPRCVSR